MPRSAANSPCACRALQCTPRKPNRRSPSPAGRHSRRVALARIRRRPARVARQQEALDMTIPSQASVVIIGGGVAGCSIAYHLTKLGVRDVVLLERRQLTCGTTWHAAGLVGQLRATRNLTELAKYTAELYGSLEAETGQATGFRQNGSVSVAKSAAR